jgi:hypothetical protein
MERVVQETNNENPDIIVLTGDFVQHHSAPIEELATKYFKRLKSKYGIFAVLGNHDHYEVGGSEKIRYCCSMISCFTKLIRSALQKVGIRVLTNESVFPCGERLQLIGVGDFFCDEFQPQRVFEKLPIHQDVGDTKTVRVVLSHNPDRYAYSRKL